MNRQKYKFIIVKRYQTEIFVGIIRTMNFADNGRRLADQEYTICTRQEAGMCSIVYEPCDENSFRIGQGIQNQTTNIFDDEGSGGGGIPLFYDEARMC